MNERTRVKHAVIPLRKIVSLFRALPGPALLLVLAAGTLEPARATSPPAPVLLDVDVEGQTGDLFSIAQAVRSPALKVVGIAVAEDATRSRKRVVQKLLRRLRRSDIPLVEVPCATARPPIAIGEWAEGETAAAETPRSATEFVLSLSKNYEKKLQVLILGDALGLAEAFQADASLGARIRRVIVSRKGSGDASAPQIAGNSDTAKTLFDAGCQLICFDNRLLPEVALAREDLVRLGKTRSRITDDLTYLAGRYPGEGDPARLAIPHSYAVSYAGSAIPELRFAGGKFVWEEGLGPVASETGERIVRLATEAEPGPIRGTTIHVLSNSHYDFSAVFSQFIFSLGSIEEENKNKLKGANKASEGVSSASDEGLSEQEKFRRQMMSFLEEKMTALAEMDSVASKRSLDYLMDSYLRFSEIGWWFPDDFYTDWRVPSGTPEKFRLGVSNPKGVLLENIATTLTLPDKVLSESIDSSTSDVLFDFDLAGLASGGESLEEIEIGYSFQVNGLPVSATRAVGIRTPR